MPDIKLTQIVRDGVPVDVNDAAKIIIDALDAKLAAANTQIGTLTATVSTKDGELAALRQQVADAATIGAAVTPSNTAPLATSTRYVYVGGAGNLTVIFANDASNTPV